MISLYSGYTKNKCILNEELERLDLTVGKLHEINILSSFIHSMFFHNCMNFSPWNTKQDILKNYKILYFFTKLAPMKFVS